MYNCIETVHGKVSQQHSGSISRESWTSHEQPPATAQWRYLRRPLPATAWDHCNLVRRIAHYYISWSQEDTCCWTILRLLCSTITVILANHSSFARANGRVFHYSTCEAFSFPIKFHKLQNRQLSSFLFQKQVNFSMKMLSVTKKTQLKKTIINILFTLI